MLPSTITICIILIVVKFLCIKNGVNGLDGSLFDDQCFNMLLLLYLPVVVIQEFLAKGVVQTVIEHVLAGRRVKIMGYYYSSISLWIGAYRIVCHNSNRQFFIWDLLGCHIHQK